MTDDPRAKAEDCRPLFELMDRVRDLAPWEWMEESEVFGVQDPETEEIAFVSVMGMGGDHYAISAYLGAHGLYGFWHLYEIAHDITPEDMFRIPQLQASFEDRETLQNYDYRLIKSLGLKYRGRDAWPMFRSYRPGYAPWQIEPDEARFLAHVLGQVLAVAPRVLEQPDLLIPEGENDYLVRVAQEKGGELIWEDTVKTIQPPAPKEMAFEVDGNVLEQIRQMPATKYKVEADFFMMPTMVGGRKERPAFPYLFMMVETTSRMILDVDFMLPGSSPEEMYGALVRRILGALAGLEGTPKEIAVRGDPLYGVLQMLNQQLNLNVKQKNRLPALDGAVSQMQDFL